MLPPGHRALSLRLTETIRTVWILPFTCFGGPGSSLSTPPPCTPDSWTQQLFNVEFTGVHIGIFRALFVTRLQWLDDKTFLDLFSISNALPGPGSTQLLFSIALLRNGVAASVVTFLIWRYVHLVKLVTTV